MSEKKLTVEDLTRVLDECPKGFGVSFIKRSNGELRHMMCQMEGADYIANGVGQPYDRKDKGLFTVYSPFDFAKKSHGPKDSGFRNIPIDGITQIRSKGRTWNVEDGVLVEHSFT